MAVKAVRCIDYDFSKLKLRNIEPLAIATQAKQFDLWAGEFIAANPTAVVLHLGCGLDGRVYRVDPPPGVSWYDVDYPDVIALRRRLYPARDGCQMIGASVTKSHWLSEVPKNHPAMIIAEGMLMHLPPNEVKRLLNHLIAHFPQGWLAFDALNRVGMRMERPNANPRTTGGTGNWVLDAPQNIKKLEPRLELVRELSTPDLPGYEKLPLSMRIVVRLMQPFPLLRRLNRLLLYRF